MKNETLTFHEKQQNQIIFWLSFIPICLNGLVSYATLRPSKPATKELRSPSFQMLGFYTLTCFFTAFITLMIPTGIWGFNGDVSPQILKTISALTAFLGWFQSVVFLAILAIIRLIAAANPIWWHTISHYPNIKKRSIICGLCIFFCNAMIFGLSNALSCEFLPDEKLLIKMNCSSWMYFMSVTEIVLLVTSALCSIIAVIMFRYKNPQELGAAHKNREYRLILISFVEWLFAATIHVFYHEYMLHKSPETLGESAYVIYWVYPKYAFLAHVCWSAIIYLSLSSELRKAIMIMFEVKVIPISNKIEPATMGITENRFLSSNSCRMELQPREAIARF